MEYNSLIYIGTYCMFTAAGYVTLKRRRRYLKIYIITIALLSPKYDFSKRKKQNHTFVSLNCDVYV